MKLLVIVFAIISIGAALFLSYREAMNGPPPTVPKVAPVVQGGDAVSSAVIGAGGMIGQLHSNPLQKPEPMEQSRPAMATTVTDDTATIEERAAVYYTDDTKRTAP